MALNLFQTANQDKHDSLGEMRAICLLSQLFLNSHLLLSHWIIFHALIPQRALFLTTYIILNYSHMYSYPTPLFARITCLPHPQVCFHVSNKYQRCSMSSSHQSASYPKLTPLPSSGQALLSATETIVPQSWNIEFMQFLILLFSYMPALKQGRRTEASKVPAVSTPDITDIFSHPALPLFGKTETLILFWLLVSTLNWMGRN